MDEDSTPITKQESSTDSGCYSMTIPPHYSATPLTALTSRKRKLSQDDSVHFTRRDPNLFSSTLNDSLSLSFERCCLGYTPNFYTERSFSESSEKRHRLDDSPKFQPKTRSAPSTPTKHLDEPQIHVEKSQSEPIAACYFNPDLNYKLGVQEKFALLYPNLHNNVSPTKVKTPEKLREFLKKVNSPAKKRLFDHAVTERRYCDPMVLFTVKNDFRHIVSNILQYLSEMDLCSVSRVSRVWRRALHNDFKASLRYLRYSTLNNSNKENIYVERLRSGKPSSPPLSPETDRFRLYTKIASRLSPSQSLHKCPRCMEPAVIQNSISLCQNSNCQYISCMNCLSFSITGPENFVDKCQSSELIVSGKSACCGRSGLYDISNSSPSFLMNESCTQTRHDSSGYASEFDSSPSFIRNLSLSMPGQQPLQPVSMNKYDGGSRRKIRRSPLISVVSTDSTPKIVEVDEPSSPPKVKLVACSKQSKKNLKRLQF